MLYCITFAIVTVAETRRRSSPPNNHLPGSEHFIMIQRGYFMEEKITFNQETGQIYWSLETQRAGCGTFSGGHKTFRGECGKLSGGHKSSAGSAASFRGVTKVFFYKKTGTKAGKKIWVQLRPNASLSGRKPAPFGVVTWRRDIVLPE